MWSRCWKKVVFGIFVSHLGYGPFYIAVVSVVRTTLYCNNGPNLLEQLRSRAVSVSGRIYVTHLNHEYFKLTRHKAQAKDMSRTEHHIRSSRHVPIVFATAV